MKKITSDINIKKLNNYTDNREQLIEDLKISDTTLGRIMRSNKPVTSFIITSAEVGAAIHDKFYSNLHSLSSELQAELIVIPYNYGANKEKVLDKTLVPFELTEDHDIHPLLKIMASMTRRPTVMNPLSSREACTGEASGIFPHPQLAFTTVPTPQHSLPKIQCTTGAVTIPDYGTSAAAQNGKFHHRYAACVVELDGDDFHIRHVIAEEDGSFHDLQYKYSCKPHSYKDKGVTVTEFVHSMDKEPIVALICGDTHVSWVDPDVKAATFTNEDSICAMLKPKQIYHHDLLDFYSRNHHHRDNFMTNYAKHKHGIDDAKQEVFDSLKFLEETTPKNTECYVIASNHNDALTRWVMESHFRNDLKNAEFLLQLQMQVLKHAEMTEHGAQSIDLFKYCAKELMTDAIPKVKDRLHFLSRDESHDVKGIEVGFHGDKGANGSRGSIRSFSKIGPKTIIGHSHSPKIVGGSYQVGTSSKLKLEYNSGPSSWLNTHCIVYANGKRALINIINGKWRR